MISTKEQLSTNLNGLSEIQLRQVGEYLEFLKFREQREIDLDESEIAALYAEFGDEDRELAEVGIADYAANIDGSTLTRYTSWKKAYDA